MILAILATLLSDPLQMPSDETYCVDVIELNHVHDSKGNLCFTQVILWKIDASDGLLHNWGWRMVREDREMPWRGGCKFFFVRHEEGSRRVVIAAPTYRIRSTNTDPEREDTAKFWNGSAPNLFVRGPKKVEVTE